MTTDPYVAAADALASAAARVQQAQAELDAALADRRTAAIEAVRAGHTVTRTAQVAGVARQTLHEWITNADDRE